MDSRHCRAALSSLASWTPSVFCSAVRSAAANARPSTFACRSKMSLLTMARTSSWRSGISKCSASEANIAPGSSANTAESSHRNCSRLSLAKAARYRYSWPSQMKAHRSASPNAWGSTAASSHLYPGCRLYCWAFAGLRTQARLPRAFSVAKTKLVRSECRRSPLDPGPRLRSS